MQRKSYFISWAGPLSGEVAEHLKRLIAEVLPVLDGWISSEDISDGPAWFEQLTKALWDPQLVFGVVVLTRESLSHPWVLFEAGSLFTRVADTGVAPMLVDLEPKDLLRSPLDKFKARRLTRSDLLGLLRTLNVLPDSVAIREDRLLAAFDKAYGPWNEELQRILDAPRPRPLPSPAEMADQQALMAGQIAEIHAMLKERPQRGIAPDDPQRNAVKLVQLAMPPRGAANDGRR